MYRCTYRVPAPPFPPFPPPPPPPLHILSQFSAIQIPVQGWLVSVPPPPVEIPINLEPLGTEDVLVTSNHELLKMVDNYVTPETNYAQTMGMCLNDSLQWWTPRLKSVGLPDPLPEMHTTFVGELCNLAKHNVPRAWIFLNCQTRSDLGFDTFLYHVRGSFTPSDNQFETLMKALVNLATNTPDDLWRAVFFEQLGELLGPGFSWAAFPRVKSRGGSPTSW
jgi:hypothetical protein